MNILKNNASEGLVFVVAMAMGFIILSPILALIWLLDRNIGKPKN